MKRKNLTFLSVIGIFFLIATITVSAKVEKGIISGQVIRSDNGQAVFRASVVIEGSNLATITDFAGNFVFDNLNVGNYTLIISHQDFQTEKRVEIKVIPGQTTFLVISMTIKDTEIKTGKFMDKFNVQGLLDGIVKEEKITARNESPSRFHEKPAISAGEASDNNYKGEYTISPGSRIDKKAPRPDFEISYGPYDMFFQDYGTNGFVRTDYDRQSTFAVDVDDASYVLVRRYLQEGYLPPSEAVRVEEFINHFDYGYNNPDNQKFRVFTEWSQSPFSPGTALLKIGIKGSEIYKKERQPLNLTLVVDISGSMGYDNRMELVKESLRLLVEQLNHRDKVGIVVYGSEARVLLEPVNASRREIIYRAIDRLTPGGSTYAEAGIRLGYKMARQNFDGELNNCLILLSDGVANVGRTSPDDIMRQVKRSTKDGVTLSAFGFGMGNYNDVLLEQLAQQGNGKYAYVNDRREARKVFVDDFIGNFQMLARDVKIQVEFDPQRVVAYRLLGYENRDVADERFSDNRQDGGEVGAGHEVTALYELILSKNNSKAKIASVAIRWKDPNQTEVTELTKDIELPGRVQPFTKSRPEYRLAVIAGKFAELLKGSVYTDDITFHELYLAAMPLVEDLPGEQTRELLDLIRLAGTLSEELAKR